MARFATLVVALVLVAAIMPGPGQAQFVDVDDIISQAVAQANAEIQEASSALSSVTSSSSSSSSAALVGGVSRNTCGTLAETTSNSCANGKCCKVAQKVTACNGWLKGYANINGKGSTCCVVLLNSRSKYAPSLFCTAAYKKGSNYNLDSSAKVRLTPSCATNGGAYGSMGCEVSWSKLPSGWVKPKQTNKPVKYNIRGANPCFGPYNTFTQITNKDGSVRAYCT